MFAGMKDTIQGSLDQLRAEGLYKSERLIHSPQANQILVGDDQPVINLCANNYLGLSNHPEIIQAAHEGLDRCS